MAVSSLAGKNVVRTMTFTPKDSNALSQAIYKVSNKDGSGCVKTVRRTVYPDATYGTKAVWETYLGEGNTSSQKLGVYTDRTRDIRTNSHWGQEYRYDELDAEGRYLAKSRQESLCMYNGMAERLPEPSVIHKVDDFETGKHIYEIDGERFRGYNPGTKQKMPHYPMYTY